MRILNLGCGVQSTTLFLMAHEGVIPFVEHAIFADTGDEDEYVYDHLRWLRTVAAPVPIIHVRTKGRLSEHLVHGTDTPTRRHASIPCFSKNPDKEHEGRLPRQCTKEYKVEIVELVIRRDIFGLRPRQHLPRDAKIVQLFGISWDERNRSIKIRCRLEKTRHSRAEFPLIDMRMTREDCQEWLKTRVPHKTPRSACLFCPNKTAEEWLFTKMNPDSWRKAVAVDNALRQEGAAANRGMSSELFLHRSLKPLSEIDFEKEAAKERERKSLPLFESRQCGDGLCGV